MRKIDNENSEERFQEMEREMVLAGGGMPPELLTLDFSKANYSSARALLGEAQLGGGREMRNIP